MPPVLQPFRARHRDRRPRCRGQPPGTRTFQVLSRSRLRAEPYRPVQSAMTPIELPGGNLLDNLPLLTQVADEDTPDDLPTLTEIVAPEHPLPALSEEVMEQLLKQLESRLDAIFAQKLSLHLEKLQRLAVEEAVNELKAALPELLREMLNTHRPHP